MVSTTTFKKKIAESITTGTLTKPSHIAFGTGTSTLTENSTSLGTETIRNAITSTNLQAQTVEMTATLTTAQGNSTYIAETGLFNAASAGDMYGCQSIIAFEKTSSFEYDITYIVRVK